MTWDRWIELFELQVFFDHICSLTLHQGASSPSFYYSLACKINMAIIYSQCELSAEVIESGLQRLESSADDGRSR